MACNYVRALVRAAVRGLGGARVPHGREVRSGPLRSGDPTHGRSHERSARNCASMEVCRSGGTRVPHAREVRSGPLRGACPGPRSGGGHRYEAAHERSNRDGIVVTRRAGGARVPHAQEVRSGPLRGACPGLRSGGDPTHGRSHERSARNCASMEVCRSGGTRVPYAREVRSGLLRSGGHRYEDAHERSNRDGIVVTRRAGGAWVPHAQEVRSGLLRSAETSREQPSPRPAVLGILVHSRVHSGVLRAGGHGEGRSRKLSIGGSPGLIGTIGSTIPIKH